jgi:hypothetical protein
VEAEGMKLWIPEGMSFSADTIKVQAEKSWNGWILFVPGALLG